jgi:HK97 family phage portal protein
VSVWRTVSKPAQAVEKRSSGILGWPQQTFTGMFSGYGGNYDTIEPTRGETALQSVAVGASCDLICSLISEMPIDIFSGTGADRTPKSTPGYLLDPGGDGYGLEDWIAQVLMSWLLRGNMFGNVLGRAPSGYMTQVQLWHPDLVSGWVTGDGSLQWSFLGQPVTNTRDMLHLRVNPIPNRVWGMSMIAAHAATIGLNLTGTQFGLQWFRDGAHPSGILQNTEIDLSDANVVKTAKERFMAAVRGNREPVVLGKGWKFDQIQINPEESQFLETNRYSAAECARMFGPGMAEILGYETGGSLTYVTVEGKSVHLSVYTLNKWMRRIERLLTSMLPRGQYAKLNRKALLETTTLDRYQAHQIALRNRWETVNEVRDDEDMTPVDWGNKPNELGPPSPSKAPTVD